MTSDVSSRQEPSIDRLRSLADDELAALIWKLQRTAGDLSKAKTSIGRGLHAHYLAQLEAARAELARRRRR